MSTKNSFSQVQLVPAQKGSSVLAGGRSGVSPKALETLTSALALSMRRTGSCMLSSSVSNSSGVVHSLQLFNWLASHSNSSLKSYSWQHTRHLCQFAVAVCDPPCAAAASSRCSAVFPKMTRSQEANSRKRPKSSQITPMCRGRSIQACRHLCPHLLLPALRACRLRVTSMLDPPLLNRTSSHQSSERKLVQVTGSSADCAIYFHGLQA